MTLLTKPPLRGPEASGFDAVVSSEEDLLGGLPADMCSRTTAVTFSFGRRTAADHLPPSIRRSIRKLIRIFYVTWNRKALRIFNHLSSSSNAAAVIVLPRKTKSTVTNAVNSKVPVPNLLRIDQSKFLQSYLDSRSYSLSKIPCATFTPFVDITCLL
jgi:hypothetical protein